MIGWKLITKWKRCGRKRSWPNLRYYAGIFLVGLRITKNISARRTGVPAEIRTEFQSEGLSFALAYSVKGEV
jgi:hypothetical protein